MTGKILLLEAYGGEIPQMVTYLNQLKMMGVFDKVTGILLGTFIKLEEAEGNDFVMAELVKRYVGKEMPIAVTGEIGHKTNSKAVIIGKKVFLL
jgi:muramoyltetrapeptide carboxypeptidase LdcA involved in peptidoglycan recycling